MIALDTECRAMAYLPERVQRIISARLRDYNCSPDSEAAAPSVLDAYGGVAICSNRYYKSLHNFKYLKASLFEADLSTHASPIMFVEQAPALFLLMAHISGPKMYSMVSQFTFSYALTRSLNFLNVSLTRL